MAKTYIAIVEDRVETRENLEEYFSLIPGYSCSISVGSVESLLTELAQCTELPKIILMDIGLPGLSGIAGTRIIKEKYPECEVIILTVSNEPDKIFEALRAGASGYLLKSTSVAHLQSFLEVLQNGGAPMSPQIARLVVDFFKPGKAKLDAEAELTKREKMVVAALLDGLSYKEAAYALHISEGTLTSHIKNIYRKLHVNCKAELFKKAYEGFI